jgi:hypothetical protein
MAPNTSSNTNMVLSIFRLLDREGTGKVGSQGLLQIIQASVASLFFCVDYQALRVG